MAFGEDLMKKLNRKFKPSSMLAMRYRNFDLVLKTDEPGNAMQLFMGKANEEGISKGNRYTRTLKYDRNDRLIKDHWARKGTAA